jgi:hypothetical protein
MTKGAALRVFVLSSWSGFFSWRINGQTASVNTAHPMKDIIYMRGPVDVSRKLMFVFCFVMPCAVQGDARCLSVSTRGKWRAKCTARGLGPRSVPRLQLATSPT